jgi:hypothetical protein
MLLNHMIYFYFYLHMGTFHQCIVFKRLRVKKRACPGLQHERLNEQLCKRLIISAAPLWGGLTEWMEYKNKNTKTS